MRVLLVAATAGEVQPIAGRLSGPASISARQTSFAHRRHEIEVLVTGVGMVAAAVWCARVLVQSRPDFALNVGVCGSFNGTYPPGSVVNVVSDCVVELGAEDGDAFLTVQELGLLGDHEPPFSGGRLINSNPLSAVAHLPQAHGITVSTAHGSDVSIARVVKRFSPDVESMEGAAFMYACLTAGVPFLQIRGVSNRVERRNRASWKMAEAIRNLSDEAVAVIDAL